MADVLAKGAKLTNQNTIIQDLNLLPKKIKGVIAFGSRELACGNDGTIRA